MQSTTVLILCFFYRDLYVFPKVYMVHAKKKCPDFLSTYRYFLSTSVGTSEGTSFDTYCTVRLKHITHAKKFFTRSEQLYIHNSPAVL